VGLYRHGVHRPNQPADVNKGFNSPANMPLFWKAAPERLWHQLFYFGMDKRHVGVAERTLKEIRTWPAGLPIFGLLTPLPATPLYKRLEAAGRLTRPKHWQEFIPFAMAHTPLKMTIEELTPSAGWVGSCVQSGSHGQAVDSLRTSPWLSHKHFLSPACVSRIYFPQMGPLSC